MSSLCLLVCVGWGPRAWQKCQSPGDSHDSSPKGVLCPSVLGLGSDMPWEFMGQAPFQMGKDFSENELSSPNFS